MRGVVRGEKPYFSELQAIEHATPELERNYRMNLPQQRPDRSVRLQNGAGGRSDVAPSVIVRADGLHKTFLAPDGHGTRAVLNNVSLHINSGEMLSIVGPSGSGKSTLLYCLAGLETASSGDVELLGRKIAATRPRELARMYRRDIGFVFQSYNLIPTLSAWENVALPHRLDGQKNFGHGVDEALDRVGLRDKSKSMPFQLSGGEQQRVAIARALSISPKVIFADEPTGALDSTNGEEVLKHLGAIVAEGGTVVLVTHDISAAVLAQSVIVLEDGRVVDSLVAPSAGQLLTSLRSRKGAGR